MVGLGVGALVGFGVGALVGLGVGALVGLGVGALVGFGVGALVGLGVGALDGLGVGDVGSSVMRERQILGADGIVVVTLVIDSHTGEYLAGPTITSRGFVYMKDAEDLLEEATAIAYEKLEKLRCQGVSDWED